jgi:hypothetical protein
LVASNRLLIVAFTYEINPPSKAAAEGITPLEVMLNAMRDALRAVNSRRPLPSLRMPRPTFTHVLGKGW